jgi:hypothetical protein
MEKTAQLAAFEAKMQTEEAPKIYKSAPGSPSFPMPGSKKKWVCVSFTCAVWLRWAWRPGGLASPIIFASGFVFVGNPNGWLNCRRETTKRTLWRPWGPP